MFPSPEAVRWQSDPQHRDIQAHEARFKALDYPRPDFVAMHTYHYAVDQDLSTCWQSFHPLEKGSFFGLRFVLPLLDLGEPRAARSIEIWSTYESTLQVLFRQMVVKSSVDGTNWVS